MISKIHIENLKSHKDTSLDIGNLTILCGQNSSGKSTIIQSLLLLRQTYLKNRLNEGLELNGDLCQIGTSGDAIYFEPDYPRIKIEITLNSKIEINGSFKAGDGTDSFLYTEEESEIDKAKWEECSLFRPKFFQYVAANRIIPESYPKKDYEVKNNRQLSLKNGDGELVAHFLYLYGKEPVSCKELLNENIDYRDLMSQTVAWQREISANVNMDIEHTGGLNYEIKFSYDTSDGRTSPKFKGTNVGFGLSYTLPLIVAILAARPGDLILLENPEAHLHPYGQAKIAELICRAAQAGIQIIIETHSDHIINGTLVAIRNEMVSKENIKIYSMYRDVEKLVSKATEIELVKGGKIGNQPEGFFDQIQKDYKTLMGF